MVKILPNKELNMFIITNEIKDDLKNMSITKVSLKWRVSCPTLRKYIEKYNLKTLTGKDGLIKHRNINGVEYKRCGTCMNWYLCDIDNFYRCDSKPDGFMSSCKSCQNKKYDKSENKISLWWNDEKLKDLSLIGDREFSKKWNISRKFIINQRKLLNIKSFNNQHGLIEHWINNDGIEYKWCSKGHWEKITNFNKRTKTWDGLRHCCNFCEKINVKRYYLNGGKETQIAYNKTPKGKLIVKMCSRNGNLKKRQAYVYWSKDEDEYINFVFDNKCAWCDSSDDIELEHFIPLSKGGKTIPGNCYPCCWKCNRGTNGKFNKLPLEWAKIKFGKNDGIKKYNNILEKLNQHYNHYLSTLDKR